MAARKRQAARRNWPANLYLNSQGYYWFKNPMNGETFGLGREFKSAADQVRAVNAELERRKGAVDLLRRIDGADTSLIAWCDDYEKEQKGAAQTLSAMKSHLKAIRAEPFAKMAISKITPLDISNFLKACVSDRGMTTAAAIRARLHDMFRAAIEQGKVEVGKNPVSSVFKPKPVVTRERMTLDDFKAILAEARKDPGDCWIANAIELALVTGQRREDIVSMQFSQARDGFLWVEQTKGKAGNKAKVRIPLDLRLDAAGLSLAEVIRNCRDSAVSKSMIHQVRSGRTSVPGKALSGTTLSWAFAKVRDAAKIKPSAGKTPCSFHEIRSLSARLFTEQYGKDFAQALLGHKSANMTALYRDNRGREWVEVKTGSK